MPRWVQVRLLWMSLLPTISDSRTRRLSASDIFVQIWCSFPAGLTAGTTSHVAELAEIIEAANPKPRLGVTYELPVIYAGNKDASEIVGERLGDKMALEVVDNLRPVLRA